MPSEPEPKMRNSQCRKIDRKYFAAALLILFLLVTAGIIQLFPPETPPDAPTHHFGNNLLILDTMEEETLKNNPEARAALIRILRGYRRNGEAAMWQNFKGGRL